LPSAKRALPLPVSAPQAQPCTTTIFPPASLASITRCAPGAEAFKRDNPNAVVELLDTGHFALETHVEHIARRIRKVIR
jgi:hypothetical protein